MHGEDAPAGGLVAVVRGPVRAVLSEYTEAMTSSKAREDPCTPQAAILGPAGLLNAGLTATFPGFIVCRALLLTC